MAWGLPKQPGMTFADPTKSRFHVRQSMKFHHGYAWTEPAVTGCGGDTTDAESNAFTYLDDSCNYDPSLTYGRVKQPAPAAVVPHYVQYDKKCLKFTAFLKQPVYESSEEAYRVRAVHILYFLEDDSITVMEPRVNNSGLWQGRMVKRGKIPKNDLGDTYHWKDLNIGKDLPMYGKVFHTVSCDLYTSEYLLSQGVELEPEEEMPNDPYLEKKKWKESVPSRVTRLQDDKLRRFLEYDGKVLKFDCVWDDRESARETGDCAGGMREYKLLYFLESDTVSIKECHDGGGRDPFPLMLKKVKLPKKWKERPVSFPSIVLETTDAEVSEYYSPRDLHVGATVFVLGRRFLLYDCDAFTRRYYKTMLNVEQPAKVTVRKDARKDQVKVLPPHINIGTPEDALQSCFSLTPKPPKKDVIKYNLNANKYLRYLVELDYIHPEDEGRRFIFAYSLADGTVRIGEVPRRNSGIREGAFLSRTMLQTPDSDPNFPTYYTPDQFYIGAIIPVFKHRFRIIGCDLFVYRYMCANPDKFPPEVVDNVRNYHLREGNLKDDLKEAIADEAAEENRARVAAIGQAAVAQPSLMQQCLSSLDVVEGSATPPRLPTPPPTTDSVSYDETLRLVRESAATCDNLKPLKGILKTGEARDDHQKVVCFNAPAQQEREGEDAMQQPHRHSQMAPAEGFCEQYKDLGHRERAARRESGECAYPPIPNNFPKDEESARAAQEARTGLLARKYGVDCAKTPDVMQLSPGAYERARALRTEPPEVSPAAARVAGLPRLPAPAGETCAARPPPPPPGRCPEPAPEDVAFACPHPELRDPCCDPDKRKQ